MGVQKYIRHPSCHHQWWEKSSKSFILHQFGWNKGQNYSCNLECFAKIWHIHSGRMMMAVIAESLYIIINVRSKTFYIYIYQSYVKLYRWRHISQWLISMCITCYPTGQYPYNVVSFPPNPKNIHPIGQPWQQGTEYELIFALCSASVTALL